MGERADRMVSLVFAVSALAIAASVVYRTWAGRGYPPQPVERHAAAATRVENWKEARKWGIVMQGDSTAPVTLVEFADLECPACRGFHEGLRSVMAAHPRELEVVLVQLPLPMHRFALPAARAMECADSVGKASAWAEVALAAQDSFGMVGWGTLAGRAGIADTNRIARCAMSATPYSRIENGRVFATRNGIVATPTIWVNGWQFRGGLSPSALDSIVTAMAAFAR